MNLSEYYRSRIKSEALRIFPGHRVNEKHLYRGDRREMR